VTVIDTIIRDVCETDPADPDLNDTVCIGVEDLRLIIGNNLAPAQGTDQCVNCGAATDPKCACERGRALARTQGADARPVAIYQIRASRFVSDWTDVSSLDPRFHDYPEELRRIVYATRDAAPSDAPNAWADLWYFVMDEAPMEFERIVTTVSPSQWHSEAHKLMRAKYPIAPMDKI
jgi:hypothetical protein